MTPRNSTLFKDGVWSLGYFRPKGPASEYRLRHQFREWIAEETDYLDRLNILWDIDVQARTPDSDWSAKEYYEEFHKYGKVNASWTDGFHHDCGGMDLFMLIWANTNPTEIRKVGTDDIIIPDPYEVVGFSNRAYEHRLPMMSLTIARRRNFIRSWTDKEHFR